MKRRRCVPSHSSPRSWLLPMMKFLRLAMSSSCDRATHSRLEFPVKTLSLSERDNSYESLSPMKRRETRPSGAPRGRRMKREEEMVLKGRVSWGGSCYRDEQGPGGGCQNLAAQKALCAVGKSYRHALPHAKFSTGRFICRRYNVGRQETKTS